MKKSILRATGLAVIAATFCILYVTCNDSGANSGKQDDRADAFVRQFNKPSSGDGNGSGNGVGVGHVHTWGDWVVTTAATCDAAGLRTRTCTIDNNHTDTEVIPKLTGAACEPTAHTHVWGNWVVTTAATCDVAGIETRTCTQDASHKETRAIAQLTGAACESTVHTHVWGDWVVTTAATCNAAGLKTRTCTIDNSHTDTEVIPKLTGAACESTVHTHVWSDWVVTIAAACHTSGLRTRTCTIDNSHTDTEVIPKLTGVGCNPGGVGFSEYSLKMEVLIGNTVVTDVLVGQKYTLRVTPMKGGSTYTTTKLDEVEFTLLPDVTAFIWGSDDKEFITVKDLGPVATYSNIYFKTAGEIFINGAGVYTDKTNNTSLVFRGESELRVRPGTPEKIEFKDPISVAKLGNAPAAVIYRGVERPVLVEVQDKYGNAVDLPVAVTIESNKPEIGDVVMKTVMTDNRTGIATFKANVTNGKQDDTFDMTASIANGANDVGRLRVGQ